MFGAVEVVTTEFVFLQCDPLKVLRTEVTRAVGAEAEALAMILVEEKLCASLSPELSSGYTDLLPRFTLFTKVGFFPVAGQAEHSLDPGRLRESMEQTNHDLGRAPDLVFLHNPERSLTGLPDAGRDALRVACAALEAAFRAAYWLPRVGRMAVGTDNPSHLRELVNALRYEADSTSVSTYRQLLLERAGRQPL